MSEKTEVKIENNSILSNGYGLIPQMVARDKTISIGAKGLYSYLSSMAGANGTCYPSRDIITHELSIGKNTFTKYLNELKDRGYIKVSQRRAGKGKMYNNVYEIVFDKSYINNMWITEPCTKNSDTDNIGEIPPCTKNSDTVEKIENTTVEPCTKKEDTEETLEFQHSTPCPYLPYTVNEDSNSNSININKPYMYIGEEENKTVNKNIAEFARLYEQNIAPIYPATRDWLIETSNEIDLPLFRRAIEICVEKEATQLAYLKGVLRKWSIRDITTYEQLQAYETEHRKQKEAKTKKTNNAKESNYKPKKTGFHNFEESFKQYSSDELDEIIRKSQREKFK
ncbi:helix-turn-helix domain-containing protein [Metaclostridioides mangenotii]|uniref:helix-turn-helix domain-containing protein n=1 Tax=Metaclostridioides mangenotii TaxID=1540 RepID=UPI000464697F|nr:helix-turn-helix domain-containing protein [Clostridioides mangenotii]